MTLRRMFFLITVLVVLVGGAALSQPQAGFAGVELQSTPVTGIVTATPMEDGSIVHTVQPGESLFLIGQAYDVNPYDIMALNGLNDRSPLYVGDRLIIRLAPTPTATIPVTPTITPTRTPRPSRTPAPSPTLTRTAVPSATQVLPTATATQDASVVGTLTRTDPLLLAIGGIGLVGILLVVAGTVMKRAGR